MGIVSKLKREFKGFTGSQRRERLGVDVHYWATKLLIKI